VVELPAVEDGLDLRDPVGPDDGDHPLLALGDHDLPGLHPVLAQRDAVEVDVDADLAGHLGERRSEPGRAAVLQRLDEPRLDQLERGLDQLLPGERVADLDGRALLGRALAQLLAREHRGAADSVTPGGRAVEDEQVSGPARTRARNAFRGQQADAHGVHEAVARIGVVEDRFAAHRRHADAVAVVADPRDGAPEAPVRCAEAQPVEERHRPCAHRDDVAQDPADPRGRPLERLDRRGMVVRLDLERDRLALAQIDHARVLARPLQYALPGRGEPLQQPRRVLVPAVLGPEQREDRQLEVIGLALQQIDDARVLGVGEAERLVQRLFRDSRQEIESSRLTRRVQRSLGEM
jgi:hypothetical protein